MPTRIGPRRPIRIYLRERRMAVFPHLTLDKFGLRFNPEVGKGQISKWEKKAQKGEIGTGIVAAYAEILGLDVTEMYSPPPPIRLPTPSAPPAKTQRRRTRRAS